jgi:hypothetical protein
MSTFHYIELLKADKIPIAQKDKLIDLLTKLSNLSIGFQSNLLAINPDAYRKAFIQSLDTLKQILFICKENLKNEAFKKNRIFLLFTYTMLSATLNLIVHKQLLLELIHTLDKANLLPNTKNGATISSFMPQRLYWNAIATNGNCYGLAADWCLSSTDSALHPFTSKVHTMQAEQGNTEKSSPFYLKRLKETYFIGKSAEHKANWLFNNLSEENSPQMIGLITPEGKHAIGIQNNQNNESITLYDPNIGTLNIPYKNWHAFFSCLADFYNISGMSIRDVSTTPPKKTFSGFIHSILYGNKAHGLYPAIITRIILPSIIAGAIATGLFFLLTLNPIHLGLTLTIAFTAVAFVGIFFALNGGLNFMHGAGYFGLVGMIAFICKMIASPFVMINNQLTQKNTTEDSEVNQKNYPNIFSYLENYTMESEINIIPTNMKTLIQTLPKGEDLLDNQETHMTKFFPNHQSSRLFFFKKKPDPLAEITEENMDTFLDDFKLKR